MVGAVRRVVGGHHRTWQAGPDAEVGGFDCELLELVPAASIVLVTGLEHAEPCQCEGG